MDSIRFGCQTYTWQMSYEKYADRLDHIIGIVAQSGMAGIEPEVCMLGPYNDNPGKLASDLSARNLTLGALCLVCDWRGPEEAEEERIEADRVIHMLKTHFPGTLLALCQMPGDDRRELGQRQSNCIACCHDIGRRAADAGIVSGFHPNSPEGSVFRTHEDYRILLDRMNPEIVGFAPDCGHIAKGGMDPVEIFGKYATAIRHVHFKDMTPGGIWAEMGKGSIDFAGIVQVLKDSNYSGWVMIEDESPRAEADPDAVTLENGRYIREALIG